MSISEFGITILSGAGRGFGDARNVYTRGKSLTIHRASAVRQFYGSAYGTAQCRMVQAEICGADPFQDGTTSHRDDSSEPARRSEGAGSGHTQDTLPSLRPVQSCEGCAPVGHLSRSPQDAHEHQESCKGDKGEDDGHALATDEGLSRRTTAISVFGMFRRGPTLTPVRSNMRSASACDTRGSSLAMRPICSPLHPTRRPSSCLVQSVFPVAGSVRRSQSESVISDDIPPVLHPM